MKFYDTHYEEYIESSKKHNYHPKIASVISNLPENCKDLRNIILYGPSGVGKYTQALKIIQKYSPSELKYEKKLTVVYNKQDYFFKISDIHFEVDMSLLGCNAKMLWNELFNQIIDVISTKKIKHGIIVCKYFHEIHSELLDIFYSYMQKFYSDSITFSFIFISEHISFIPENITNACRIIPLARPSKTTYNRNTSHNKISATTKLTTVSNVKTLQANIADEINPYKTICNPIIDEMVNLNQLKFLQFRDLLYDLFIYNLSIDNSVWYILVQLCLRNKLKISDMSEILIETYRFFKLFNNNYRPIYHLESYMFYLTRKIHELPESL